MNDHLNEADRALCEALERKVRTGRVTLGGGVIDSKGSGRIWGGEPIYEPANPNGSTAAQRIRTLSRDLAAAEALADKLAEALGAATDGWDDEALDQIGAREALWTYAARLIDG